jgi:hypothetical protein
MSLSLLFPLGLLALASLLVPLLIHLARRHHYAPLEFAALRWLRAKARPRQRVRFDEWPLLLVRLLLLAALAVLLARPLLHGAPLQTPPWVVVAPGLPAVTVPEGSEGRWLATGFPPLTDTAPGGPQPLASLLRELDQAVPAGAAVTVYVPDPMPGLDGERPHLSRAVDWRPVAVASTDVSSEAGLRDDTRGVSLRVAGAEDARALRVLDAVQRAWSNTALPTALGAETLPEPGEVGVWLADAPLPAAWQAWVQAGGTVLTTTTAATGTVPVTALLRDAQGTVALFRQAHGRGQVLRFAAPLSPDALPILREPDFPRRLLTQVSPDRPPQLGAAADQAPLTGAAPPQPQPRELATWLLALIVALFALERWMATSPRRGAGA